MADKKISELNSLTGANAADGDLVAIVDVSATETKKITRSEFFTNVPSIDVTGNVGIGTSSPSVPLAVSKNLTGVIASFTNQTSADFQINLSSGVSLLTPSTGVLALGTSNTERMRITSGGTLQIAGGGNDNVGEINMGNTAQNANRFQVRHQSSAWYLKTVDSEPLVFGTANTERMRIDSSGNLLVGTTFSSGKLTVNATGDAFSATSGADALVMISKRGNDGDHIRFLNSSSVISGNIGVTGTTTYYNTSSDYRLKEDVQPMVGASDRVLSLKPCNFAWKVDGSRVDGFLAHEAQAVVPEAVTGEKDGEEMQAIDQSKLVPLLTAALQEALTEINNLKARVATLEG